MFNQKHFNDAVKAIKRERFYQEEKYPGDFWAPAEWLNFIQSYVDKAKDALTECETQSLGRLAQMTNMRKIAALAVAAMEQQGVVFREVLPKDLKPCCQICGATKGSLHYSTCRYAGTANLV